MRSKGLEPLRAFTHQLLRLARLPIPPRPQAAILTAALGTSEMFMNSVQRSQVRAAPRLPVVGPKKRPAEYVGPAVNDFPRLFHTEIVLKWSSSMIEILYSQEKSLYGITATANSVIN